MHARLLPIVCALLLAPVSAAWPDEAAVPARSGISGSLFQHAGEAADAIGSQARDLSQHVLDTALDFLGVDYRWGGESAQEGFDCSGLVQFVFLKATGLLLPRTALQMSHTGEAVRKNALQPGDLVFFHTLRHAFSHVGIYIGNGEFVHAPSRGGQVRIESLHSHYWNTRYNGARRIVLPTEDDDSQLRTADSHAS